MTSIGTGLFMLGAFLVLAAAYHGDKVTNAGVKNATWVTIFAALVAIFITAVEMSHRIAP